MRLTNNITRKVIAGLLIAIIISFGIFKASILNVLHAFVSEYLVGLANFMEGFKSVYKSGKDIYEWMAHYVFYYPIYLSFHFILILILFYNQRFLRNTIMLSLLGILVFLILGKIIFGYFGATVMAEYFSFAFHKLVALPFILLVIEGGRQIWAIVQQSDNKQ